jgi:hypothetical protein
MTLASSPGKMDLSALKGALKPRPLQSAPAAEGAPTQEVPAPAATPVAPDAVEGPVEGAVETAVDAAVEGPKPVAEPAAETTVKVVPAEEEHSGHVTLYLPKELNQWLGRHRDSTGVSYPGIVLKAITWAHAENRMSEIFAPEESQTPANDLFARATAIIQPARAHAEPETRPLRFRKDHMQVIISLARTWTADNRNAFFVGVLSAYRDDQTRQQEAV